MGVFEEIVVMGFVVVLRFTGKAKPLWIEMGSSFSSAHKACP